MSNFVFNNAKGKVAYYASLPGTSDALVLVPLQAAGIELDNAMMARTSLANLLTASSEQTTLGRTTLAGVTVNVNNTTNTVSVDADDLVYEDASGAAIAAFVVGYVPDTTDLDDADVILLTKHDFSVIPSGTDIPVQISSNGIFSATAASSL